MSIRRLCCCPGCSRFREEGSKYCSKHREKYEAIEEQRKKEWLEKKYNWSNRQRTLNPERRKFYGARWRKARKLFLENHPYCSCEGCNQMAMEIHHDWPVGYDYWNEHDFYDSTHWVGLCRYHHQQISNERREKK